MTSRSVEMPQRQWTFVVGRSFKKQLRLLTIITKVCLFCKIYILWFTALKHLNEKLFLLVVNETGIGWRHLRHLGSSQESKKVRKTERSSGAERCRRPHNSHSKYQFVFFFSNFSQNEDGGQLIMIPVSYFSRFVYMFVSVSRQFRLHFFP